MPLYVGRQDPLDHVVSFLQRTIRDYAIGDLERLGKIRPDPEPPNLRGCTVPECLTIFAVLDLLGFLMRSDFDDEKKLDVDRLIADQINCIEPTPADNKILDRIENKGVRGKTSRNLEYMLRTWLSTQREGYDELAIDLIVKLFRHGGAHQFLPKAAGIAKWGRKHPCSSSSMTMTMDFHDQY